MISLGEGFGCLSLCLLAFSGDLGWDRKARVGGVGMGLSSGVLGRVGGIAALHCDQHGKYLAFSAWVRRIWIA